MKDKFFRVVPLADIMTAVELAIEIEKRTNIRVLFEMRGTGKRNKPAKRESVAVNADEVKPSKTFDSLKAGMEKHWTGVRKYAKKNKISVMEARKILKKEKEDERKISPKGSWVEAE